MELCGITALFDVFLETNERGISLLRGPINTTQQGRREKSQGRSLARSLLRQFLEQPRAGEREPVRPWSDRKM